ncbi:MAG: primary-amine oxidase [Pseudomonadota bacterium]|nr:primary-amine oxidase [Pseudomonadota bacterium]
MTHPLDPLSEKEIYAALEIFHNTYAGTETFFSSAGLLEPPKHLVKSGTTVPRVVKLLGVDNQRDGGFAAEIDLTSNSASISRLPASSQAPYSYAELGMAVMLTKQNQTWLEAITKRGIPVSTEKDLKLIQVDPWPAGGFVDARIPEGHRAVKCIAFLKEDESDNGYARPVHGLIAHVDITGRRVVGIEDSGVVPMPKKSGRFDNQSQSSVRADLKDIEITQPKGPSFKVDGYKISWQGYEFRVGMHPVNGLVLHQISLQGRPILYRAALSDMVVPYGDQDPMHSWKHVLDASEYNMGQMVNSLKLGCDCLGEIYYFNIDQITWDGKVKTVENAICMHEEDYGIQWKHHDTESNKSEVRRSRRLVVSSIFTVGNYDYGFYWYLYLDGTIQMEVKLTGIVGVSAIDGGKANPGQSPQISSELSSPLHQHLFCFRLDWDLDGGLNALYENQIEVLPIDKNNPHGTQFRSVSRQLTDEHSAKRNIAPEVSRHWRIVNPTSFNGLGKPVAYKLLPQASPSLLANPNSPVGRRAAFGKYHLWATPYADDELFASGPHTVMHEGQNGLQEITKRNRDIRDCDLVVWHTVGVTHVPRPEDWPVMPVEYCGFHLIPTGFFDRNPTLDLAASCKG